VGVRVSRSGRLNTIPAASRNGMADRIRMHKLEKEETKEVRHDPDAAEPDAGAGTRAVAEKITLAERSAPRFVPCRHQGRQCEVTSPELVPTTQEKPAPES